MRNFFYISSWYTNVSLARWDKTKNYKASLCCFVVANTADIFYSIEVHCYLLLMLAHFVVCSFCNRICCSRQVIVMSLLAIETFRQSWSLHNVVVFGGYAGNRCPSRRCRCSHGHSSPLFTDCFSCSCCGHLLMFLLLSSVTSGFFFAINCLVSKLRYNSLSLLVNISSKIYKLFYLRSRTEKISAHRIAEFCSMCVERFLYCYCFRYLNIQGNIQILPLLPFVSFLLQFGRRSTVVSPEKQIKAIIVQYHSIITVDVIR